MIGQMRTNPGPFTGIILPRRNTTPLSYSLRIFIALERKYTTRNITKRKLIKDGAKNGICTSFSGVMN
jgi:hypothetical protein